MPAPYGEFAMPQAKNKQPISGAAGQSEQTASFMRGSLKETGHETEMNSLRFFFF